MQQGEEVVYLYLDDIIPNRFQPREVFADRPLKELAVSIKEHGVIQPIIVRKVNDKYEIIAGERRYKASALAGLTKIPAIVRDLDDKETSKVALLENLQRKDLNPLEEAKTYQKILEIDEMTQEDLAKTMGKSQSAVSNKLRLLSLPEEIQNALLKEEISERHARTLLSVENQEEQKNLLKEIIENKMTVRQLEAKIKGEKETLPIEEPMPIPENSQDIGTSTNFLNSNPLIPDFNGEMNEDNSTTEPLIKPFTNEEKENKEPLITMNINENNETISDLHEENNNVVNEIEPLIVTKDNSDNKSDIQVENNKYINFGEIDDDSDDDDSEKFYENTNSSISFGSGPISADTTIDLNNLKQNTQDINSPEEKNTGADLDNLLRINSQSSPIENKAENDSFKFFSPAAEAIKDSEENDTSKNSEDYFKAPDLINVDLPGEELTYNTNNVPLSVNDQLKIEENKTEDKLDNAINIIKNSLEEIEKLGLKVEKDEMNMNNSYQIIIKLNKNS